MSFYNKFERKIGRHAIQNLTIYIIACYVAGYALQFLAPNILGFLSLDPAYILRGQVWRLVTWVLVPPETLSIFTIIMLFFYYSIGTTLERTWGAARYNIFIFSGLLFTILGAFILYGIAFLIFKQPVSVGNMFSTYYISMSIFLAFAITYPNMQVLLYFIIPLKVKWLGYFYVAILAYEMIMTNWAGRVAIIASLLNVIIFFFETRNIKQRFNPKQVHRKMEFKKAAQTASNPNVTKHKCAVCGRTEKDDPSLEFRFCSKCNGNYEYCQDHLFTHEHIK